MAKSKKKAAASAAASATAAAMASANQRKSEGSSSSSSKPAASTKTKLHSAWTMYYHNPEDKDWSPSSYTEVATFDTVEDFWQVYNAIPSFCMQFGMFFLMRKGVQPTWEDVRNRNGGCWSYKIPLAQVTTIWRDMAVQLISENLSSVDELLNGISISPKKGFCVIKIWNNNSRHSATSLLHATIPALNHTEALFVPFKNKN